MQWRRSVHLAPSDEITLAATGLQLATYIGKAGADLTYRIRPALEPALCEEGPASEPELRKQSKDNADYLRMLSSLMTFL